MKRLLFALIAILIVGAPAASCSYGGNNPKPGATGSLGY